MSGAVLWVVAGDQQKPTSDEHAPADPEPVAYVPPEPPPLPPPPPPRRPATSRRRPPVVEAPAVVTPPSPMAVQRPVATMTVRMAGAPLPRHRLRSSVLLVLLVALIGLLVAVVVGVVVAALAFALRSAVTS